MSRSRARTLNSAGLRPVDVARALGCTAQLVRNLERDGVLPPAARTASGYRVYTQQHLRSALAYQALTPGTGPVEAKRILRTLHEGRIADALALLDAAHARLHAERTRLHHAREAAQVIWGEVIHEVRPSDCLSISELADALGARPSTLRHWEAEGLLATHREDPRAPRRYSPEQVRDARVIHQLRAAGYRIPAVRALVPQLRRAPRSPEITAALSARDAAITTRSRALLDGAAALAEVMAPATEPSEHASAHEPSHLPAPRPARTAASSLP